MNLISDNLQMTTITIQGHRVNEEVELKRFTYLAKIESPWSTSYDVELGAEHVQRREAMKVEFNSEFWNSQMQSRTIRS